MEIAIVLGLLLVVIFLFSLEKFPVDVITLGMLVVLMTTRILTPAEAFAGFGSDFIIILACIFVISGALQQTGVLDLLGSKLLKLARVHPNFILTYIMTTVGFTSAFMNNTTVTAVFLAPVMGLARKLKVSPSRLLMPVAFASIIGGTCTIIGTSTNIAVSGYLERIGIYSLSMFEFLPIGLTLFGITLVYMVLIGKRMMPDRGFDPLSAEVSLREYVSEIVIKSESDLIGQYIFKSDLSKMGFRILNVLRGDKNFIPDQSTRVEANDLMIIEGNMEHLMKIKETVGIDIRADVLLAKEMQTDNIKLAEVLMTPQTEFLNTSLKDSSFRQKFGLVVLAISRSGQSLKGPIGKVQLKVGDILLVQGPADTINYIKQKRELSVMDDFKPLLYKTRKGIITLFIFIAAILAGSFNVLPLSASLLIATIMVVGNKSITVERAYETIDWRLLILIGGMASFGTAMTKSGASVFLAEHIVEWLGAYGTTAIMAGFLLLTVFLTQPMSNAAAALVVLPVAIQTAQQLGVSPMPFAIAVMLSASVSLITPLEPSCILVYGPGRYRFFDFVKSGSVLTLLLLAVLLILIPVYYPY